MTWLDRFAIASIEAYQRHLSPRKGFRCAYRVLHGGRSCSEFARRVLLRGGLAAMTRLLPGRFDRCAAAARVLESRQVLDYESKRQPEKKTGNFIDDCGQSSSCDSPTAMSIPIECAGELACAACAAGC
jgi:putative component of membrane protein insertase Oxa1/YidC/SpoIIIJ protein YidD